MTDGADLRQLLDRGLAGGEPGWSRSSHAIAAYLRDNWHNLPYETGASIAVAVEVSEMTVIRFIRQLGFNNLRDIKEALKSAEPREAGEMPEIIHRPPPPLLSDPAQDRHLKAEIEGITAAYRLTALPAWRAATDLLAKSEFLSLTGFGTLTGQAQDLTTRLQQLRPQARYIADSTNNTAEILDLTGRSHCLMMLEDGSSALRALELGTKAKALSIPMIVLTSGNAQWAHEISGTVLHLPVKPAPLWPSPLPVAAALNLLLRDVAGLIGPAAAERFARLTGSGAAGGAAVGGSAVGGQMAGGAPTHAFSASAPASARQAHPETALRIDRQPYRESPATAPVTLPPRDHSPIPQAPAIPAPVIPAPVASTPAVPAPVAAPATSSAPRAETPAAAPQPAPERPAEKPAEKPAAAPSRREAKSADQGRLF